MIDAVPSTRVDTGRVPRFFRTLLACGPGPGARNRPQQQEAYHSSIIRKIKTKSNDIIYLL